MAAPQQQQGGGGDSSLGPFWILVGLFVFGWGIWYFGHAYIATVILHMKFYEAYLVSFFTNKIDLFSIKNASASDVSFNALATISTDVGTYLRYPLAAI